MDFKIWLYDFCSKINTSHKCINHDNYENITRSKILIVSNILSLYSRDRRQKIELFKQNVSFTENYCLQEANIRHIHVYFGLDRMPTGCCSAASL